MAWERPAGAAAEMEFDFGEGACLTGDDPLLAGSPRLAVQRSRWRTPLAVLCLLAAALATLALARRGQGFSGSTASPQTQALFEDTTEDGGLVRIALLPTDQEVQANAALAAATPAPAYGAAPPPQAIAAPAWTAASDSQSDEATLSVEGFKGPGFLQSLEATVKARFGKKEPPPPAAAATPAAATAIQAPGNASSGEGAAVTGDCNATEHAMWQATVWVPETGGQLFSSTMSTCGRSCWGQRGCTEDCVTKALGYHRPCTPCFSGLAVCMMGHCMWQCVGGESEGCKQCGRENCRPGFTTCSGFAFPPYM